MWSKKNRSWTEPGTRNNNRQRCFFLLPENKICAHSSNFLYTGVFTNVWLLGFLNCQEKVTALLFKFHHWTMGMGIGEGTVNFFIFLADWFSNQEKSHLNLTDTTIGSPGDLGFGAGYSDGMFRIFSLGDRLSATHVGRRKQKATGAGVGDLVQW